jgi:hypothetical protein
MQWIRSAVASLFLHKTNPPAQGFVPALNGFDQRFKLVGPDETAFTPSCSWRTNSENNLAKSSRDFYLMRNLDQL